MLKLSEEVITEFSSLKDMQFEYQRELTKFSTMKAKSFGSIAHIETQEALSKFLKIALSHGIDYRVVGWGANFVLPESTNFILIHLNFSFDKKIISSERKTFILPASTPLNQLTSLAIKFGLKGWDVFTGIPASLGGAIYMNAGTNLGEIGDLIHKVWLMDKHGNVRDVVIDKNSFGYRANYFVKQDEIIISAEVIHKGIDLEIADKIKDYLELRQTTQPLRDKSCGCMFKNHKKDDITCPAGLYLDIMGLRGFTANGFRISPVHANFLVNVDDGNLSGLVDSLEMISRELEGQYGIKFEQEIRN